MARYEHLPIYISAMAVAIHCEKVVAGFSRYHKYTLGTELRNTSREIVNLIVAANSSQEKLSRLLTLRERLESLLILMRLCQEVKAFNPHVSISSISGNAFSESAVPPMHARRAIMNLDSAFITRDATKYPFKG